MTCEYLVHGGDEDRGFEMKDNREIKIDDLPKANFKHICNKNGQREGYTACVGYISDQIYERFCKTDDDYKECRVYKGEVDTDGNPIFL